ncbi:MAG: hypothetical protein ACTSVU_05230 [Promethearchaeota archaeon]
MGSFENHVKNARKAYKNASECHKAIQKKLQAIQDKQQLFQIQQVLRKKFNLSIGETPKILMKESWDPTHQVKTRQILIFDKN